MSNEQLAILLMSIINNLEVAIMQTIDNFPPESGVQVGVEGNMFNPLRTIYPSLDPILEVKESLYQQLNVLKGIK